MKRTPDYTPDSSVCELKLPNIYVHEPLTNDEGKSTDVSSRDCYYDPALINTTTEN